MKIISTIINMITNPPTMIPIIAPMGKSSATFLPSGGKGTLEVVTDDVTDMVSDICDVLGGRVVNSLEGVTSLITTVEVNKHELSLSTVVLNSRDHYESV